MKKAIAILLMLVMALGLYACSAGTPKNTEPLSVDWTPMIQKAGTEIKTINDTVFADGEFWFITGEWNVQATTYTIRIEFNPSSVEEFLNNEKQEHGDSDHWEDYCTSYWEYMRELESSILESTVPKTLAVAEETVRSCFAGEDVSIILQYKNVDGNITNIEP